jgi:hypothetical protein
MPRFKKVFAPGAPSRFFQKAAALLRAISDQIESKIQYDRMKLLAK